VSRIHHTWRCFAGSCLVLALFACAGNPKAAGPDISPTSPRQVADLQITPPSSARCRLPVAGFQGARRIWTGFVDLSSGRAIAADLRRSLSTASEVSYETSSKRWLPVPERAVSPNGKSYARLEITPAQASSPASARLSVVEIATGQERLIWQSQGPNVAVVGWDGNTVMVNRLVGDVAREQGRSARRFSDFVTLWAVDSAGTALPREVGPAQADYEYFSAGAIHAGYAWGLGPARPSEPSHVELRRLDIRTGLLSDYLALDAGFEAGPFGFDSTGRLAMLLRPAAAPISSPATSPAAGRRAPRVAVWEGTVRTADLALPSDFSGDSSYGLAIHLDTRGIWLTSHAVLWFWSARGGELQRVGDLSALAGPARSSPDLRFTVAGACQ